MYITLVVFSSEAMSFSITKADGIHLMQCFREIPFLANILGCSVCKILLCYTLAYSCC
jgi:hypothetical protein